MRGTLAAAALALLCLTAGCSLGGSGTPTATPTAPATPTATPTPTSTPTPTPTAALSAGERPPGVADGRLADESALLASHARLLVTDGGVWDVRTNATVAREGSLRNVSRQQRTFIEPGRAEYYYRVFNPRSRFDAWGNRSLQVLRARIGDRERYRVGRAPGNRSLSGAALLAAQIPDAGLSVARVDRSGDRTTVTLRTTTPPESAAALPPNATRVRGYEARLVVDPAGRVVAFRASATYDLPLGDGTVAEGVEYDITYRLVSRAPPEIQQPDWARRALEDGDG